MPVKIGVVTTEYMRPHLEACFARLGLDCDIVMYLYEPSDDLHALYCSIPDSVAGIMTSGNRFSSSIQEIDPLDSRVIIPLALDDAALHRLFWRLQREAGQPLDPGRIYCDFLEQLHIPVEQFLIQDYGGTLSASMNAEREDTSGEPLQFSEINQYHKLLSLWSTGEFDVIITRFSGLIPQLREQGVRAYCPYPSVDNVRMTCQQILQEIQLRQMRQNQAAEIHVNVWLTNPAYSMEPLFEAQCNRLQLALKEFFSRSEDPFLLRRNHFGVVVMTDRKTVQRCTHNYSDCMLSAFLASRLGFKVSIGYGIGHNTYQAQINAINATRESKVRGHSYLIDDNNVLVGPLDTRDTSHAAIRPTVFSFLAEHTKLSEHTVSRVLTALEHMPNQRITSQELAQALSISRRTANHFLTVMCEAGILKVVSTRHGHGRGRPEKVLGRADMLGLFTLSDTQQENPGK